MLERAASVERRPSAEPSERLWAVWLWSFACELCASGGRAWKRHQSPVISTEQGRELGRTPGDFEPGPP